VAHHFYTPDQFRFIRLSQGRVRYILRGGDSATTTSSGGAGSMDSTSTTSPIAPRPVVVLVHGFSIAADIWKQQADHLVSRGFTVLSFDNYGRGWSDAPDPSTTAFDSRLYVGQLAELLFALDIRGPVDLCGVSMGGSIATHFAAAYPAKVRRLCLVCPAGLPIGPSATFSGLMALPVLGALAFKRAVAHMQARGAAAQWEQSDSAAYHAWHAYAAQNVAAHPGFVRTLHRTVVEYPLDRDRPAYALLAQNPRLPVLLIWGERDGLTPYRNAGVLRDLLPGSQLVTVVGAKHNMLIERAQPIAEVMAAWIADSDARMPERVHTTLHDQGQIEGR
jgi:pimeloyl-ACP methyl ester carboxylesterase